MSECVRYALANERYNDQLMSECFTGRFCRAGGLPIWLKHGLASALVVASFATHLTPLEWNLSPLLAFMPAILAAAFLFGGGAGLFTALLSTAAGSILDVFDGD